MPDILNDILNVRRTSVQQAKEKISLSEMEKKAQLASASLGFLSAIKKEGEISLIAEMKSKSPSAGDIRPLYDVKALSQSYEKGGARALSVLTESDYFGGKIEDIQLARGASKLPILRKDFIFDPYQIYEARVFGADAVLLIADMLEAVQLKELVEISRSIGLEALVEVFTSDRIPSAINSGSQMIGINTRNLRTLEISPDNVFAFSRLIPHGKFLVAESGIRSEEEIKMLKGSRITAVLVGESLLKKEDVEAGVKQLVQAGRGM